ncbi:unnamed protein product [Fusarium graminearum]|uniref:Chromosome 4, complete genome n=1 Tax=Gibberella zeae (strain ATCC MYA-4620 / CBS 123657 / FGSC 9075 / NRRL 31084 / PH-1) TaxID=229533 RepID=A0A098DU95_GIBZE|nr:unnamed protein product [Fusarium graminearum]CZS72302.1 unnamed protein product [Fusarium graminearum]
MFKAKPTSFIDFFPAKSLKLATKPIFVYSHINQTVHPQMDVHNQLAICSYLL